ncbi:MAG TPA: DUF1549 and DUF1553 domain-containing protein, partial [Tepidisphaeraceae bacterium]|nr:DUF1549 and DUF1553 domain-containing protein [Tepidisphaeraceae bacterium]
KGERLTAAEVELIKRWVEEGAHWNTIGAPAKAVEITQVEADVPISEADREWWSFRKPIAHDPPTTRSRWGTTKIDRFILAKLEEAGIAPSSPASAREFIRRATYDLTGLPPTPEDVENFIRDKSPMAKQRLVEKLLASPAFGERMASLWLPLARYAEDQAHQVGSDTKFFYPNAWRYRAWVINAFNRDLSYDRFIKLQLAADKIPDASTDDLPALGFIGLGPKYYSRNRLDVMAEEWEDRVDTVSRTMLGLTVACAKCHDHKFDPIRTRDYYALAGIFASTKMVNRTSGGVEVKGDTKAEQMDPTTLHIVEDGEVQNLNIFIRGNVERKGPAVPRRFIRVLCDSEPRAFKEGSGRKELAEAIASPQNPLTARVMVNRLWGMLMGRPLVATPSNFGHSGELPTHPELLDDLAVRFMENDWSIKWLVREIVLSATYGQSSLNSARGTQDPSNVLMWRMNRRRLSVEQWRDMVLLTSGRLAAGGGKSMELDDPNNFRRTVYGRVSRLKLNDLLMQFDYPDANVHAEKRSVTTTPAQKLFMLNSPFVIGAAKSLVARLRAEGIEEDSQKVERVYGLVFGRKPRAEEYEMAREFLNGPEESGMSRWQQYAQVMLVCSEAIYVD